MIHQIDQDRTDEYPNPYPLENRSAALALEEAARRIKAKRDRTRLEDKQSGVDSNWRNGVYAGFTVALVIINDVLLELLPPS